MKKNKKSASPPEIKPSEESTPFFTAKLISIFKTVAPILVSIQIWLYVFSGIEKFIYKPHTIDEEIHKRTILIIISILLLLFSFLFFFRLSISSKIKNIGLLIYSTVFFFLIAEIIFMYAPVSQGNGSAYCSRLWFHKYWHENELGYRDKPYNAFSDSLKEKIVMLGDSYVAGHGIIEVEDRMSDLLENKLGKNYRVFNLGKNGSSTEDEFERLKKFPYPFDKLILVHVPNDLEYLDVYENSDQELDNNEQNGIGTFFVRESFFINFLSYTIIGDIYNGIKQLLFSSSEDTDISELSNYPFSDSVKLNKHIQNLIRIDSALKINNTKMFILSFPYPGQNDSLANKYYDGFIHQLKMNNFNFMDAHPICNKLALRQQVVNTLDGHPSKKVLKMVTDSLYNRLKQEHWF